MHKEGGGLRLRYRTDGNGGLEGPAHFNPALGTLAVPSNTTGASGGVGSLTEEQKRGTTTGVGPRLMSIAGIGIGTRLDETPAILSDLF